MGAPVRKDPASKTASAQRRGSRTSGAGSYGVGATVESGVGGDGRKEVFTIPDFVPGTHDLGYDHWICDPNGTFDES